MKNHDIFWSEIGSEFRESGCTCTPPRNTSTHPSPDWNLLVLIPAAMFFLQSWVACGQGGQVSLLFRSFSNPSSRTMSGACCDPACAVCNYYFVFCIRIDLTSNNYLLSGQTSTYHNYKHIVFTDGHSLGNGWKNPLSNSFTTWKVSYFDVYGVK